MVKIVASLGLVVMLVSCGSASLAQGYPANSGAPIAEGPPDVLSRIDSGRRTGGDTPLIDDRRWHPLDLDTPARIEAPIRPAAPAPLNAQTPEHPAVSMHRPGPGDWLEAQFFFIIWGLIATVIALVICPRASLMTAAAIETEPLRCAAVGTVGLLAIGLFNVLNTILFGAALWAPVGILFFILSMVIFIYSAILGIVFIGSGVARKFGWHGLGFFGRAAAGFAALAILNCLPVAGMASMGLQCVAVLCGLGGLIITGFGSDPHWLTRILSGNRPK